MTLLWISVIDWGLVFASIVVAGRYGSVAVTVTVIAAAADAAVVIVIVIAVLLVSRQQWFTKTNKMVEV